MKKYFSVYFAALLLSVILPLCSSAASINDYALGWEDKQSELSQIESKYENHMGIVDDSIPNYKSGYIVYYFADEDIVDRYEKTGIFEKLISEYYTWRIPTEGNGLVTLVKNKNGDWETAEAIMPNLKINGPWNLIVDKGMVSNVISQKASSITGLKYVESVYYNTTFVYFTTDGKEYLIPFSGSPNFNGLENGKIYEPAEVMSTLEKNLGVPSVGNGELTGGGAGLQQPADSATANDLTIFVWIAISIVIFAGVAVAIVYRRKAGKNK